MLHDASLLAVGGEGVAPAKFFVDETLDPDVDGGHRGAAIAEEADAVGDFFADAVQREQAGKEGVVGENGQRIEVEGAGGGLRGGVLDVAGAVAQPAAVSCASVRPQSCSGVGKRKTSSPSAQSGSPQHRANCSTAVRMAGMLLRWEMMKVTSISHGS